MKVLEIGLMLGVVFGLDGCATFVDTSGVCNVGGERRIYGGVRLHFENMKGDDVRADDILFRVIDLPLSFVADTLVLPWIAGGGDFS